MPAERFNNSQPCAWVQPRPHTDASQRYQKHGPIVPMDEAGPAIIYALKGGLGLFALGVVVMLLIVGAGL